MIFGCFSASIGKFIGMPAHWTLSFYEILGKWAVKLLGAVLSLGCEETWQLITYYGVLITGLLFLWYGRRKIYLI